MSTSRSVLLQDLGAEMGDVVTGTASGGSTTTIVDDASAAGNSPLSSADNPQRFNGHWSYIASGSSGSAPDFEERRISSYTPSTWTLTVADAFSAALAASDTYELHALCSRADKVLALNRALTQRCWYRGLTPLTLITDGDFETSGTTSFTGSNATLSKSTTAVQIHRGTQAMQMLSTSTSASFYNATALPVTEGESFRAEVTVRSNNRDTFTLEAYDVTNSASIATQDAAYDDIGGWQRIELQFSVPTNCRSLRLSCKCAANATTSWWDDLILTATNRRTLPLPAWCDSLNVFEWVYRRTSDDPDEWHLVPLRECRPQFDLSAANPGTVSISADGVGRPLYVAGSRFYSALTTDAATTPAPAEWVRAATAVEILRTVWGRARGTDRKLLERDLEFWRRRLGACVGRYSPRREYAPLRLGERGA